METQRSSLGNRFFASLIDYLVIGCVFMIYVYKFGEPNNEGGYTVRKHAGWCVLQVSKNFSCF